MAQKKNPAAVALGRLGGKKKVPKGLSRMDAEQAASIRKAGAAARWERWRKDNPDKAAAAREAKRRKAKAQP
jgi:hypothetical protein